MARRAFSCLALALLAACSPVAVQHGRPAAGRVSAPSDVGDDVVYLLDRFSVPKDSVAEFRRRAKYNRDFVASLPGYVRGESFETTDALGNLTWVTLAIWENAQWLGDAKRAVQAEFRRIGFDPGVFFRRLRVTLERAEYRSSRD